MSERFNLKPSQYHFFITSIVIIVSLIILYSFSYHPLLKIFATLFVFVYGTYLVWGKVLLRGQKSVFGIQCHPNKRWHLYVGDKIYEAELCGDSTVTRFITILRFRLANHFFVQSCIIFPDSLPADRYRQLLILLNS